MFSLFDPDIDALSEDEEKVDEYLEAAPPGGDATAPSGAPTAAMGDLMNQLEKKYGPDYKTRVFQPCVEKLDGGASAASAASSAASPH